MTHYSINQFSKITGINKILIRTWENRYNFIKPKRTSTNIRVYDQNMLNLGIKYGILVDSGHKISNLVKYDQDYINSLIEHTLETTDNIENQNRIYISKFVESAILFNQDLFEKTYNTCINKLGFINFYKNILIKTMSKISILFLKSEIDPSHEHFLSENIRLKLSSEIEKIENPISENRWVLFLPENEYHDIGLLFTYFILKKKKQRVIYLGQNVPRESLLQFNNSNLLFFLNANKSKDYTEKLCSYLNFKTKNCHIYLIERTKANDKIYSNITKISDIDKFIDLI